MIRLVTDVTTSGMSLEGKDMKSRLFTGREGAINFVISKEVRDSRAEFTKNKAIGSRTRRLKMSSVGCSECACIVGAELGTTDESSILLEGSQQAIRHERRRESDANGEDRIIRENLALKVAIELFEAIMETTTEGKDEVAVRKVNAGEREDMKVVVPGRDVGRDGLIFHLRGMQRSVWVSGEHGMTAKHSQGVENLVAISFVDKTRAKVLVAN
jgi:hypothetical protein